MPPPPSLVAVACTLRYTAPNAEALPHIALSVSAFLDVSVLMPLKKAAASGSLRLFRRVLARLDESTPPIDEFLRVDSLSESMAAAAERGHLAVAQHIHAIHPGRLQCTPLAIAAHNGDMAMVQWLLENRRDDCCCVPSPHERDPEIEVREDPPRCCLNMVFESALAANQFAAIKWLIQRGYHWLDSTDFPSRAGLRAARIGDLNSVKWLHERNEPNTFSTEAIGDAAHAGHTEVVAFLLENRTEGYRGEALQDATIRGHDKILELLQSPAHQHLLRGGLPTRAQWVHAYAQVGRFDLVLRELQSPEFPMESLGFTMKLVCFEAVSHGNLHFLQWVHEHIKSERVDNVKVAAKFGRLDVVQWFHQQYSCAFTGEVMDIAAETGHLEIVKWLHFHRTEGCSQDAMDGAAEAGHLHVVQWLHGHRTEGCTTRAIDRAARNGRHDVVKWLHEHRSEGCTTWAMDDAAANSDLELVKWLHEHRSEGCTTAAMDGAAANGDLELVIWLHEHRSEGCSTRAMDEAPLYVAQWLHFNRAEGCTTNAMDGAAMRGDLAKLQFLHAYRTEGCTTEAAVNATLLGHLYIVQWLRRYHAQSFDLVSVTSSAQDMPHIRSWLESIQ